MYSNDVVFVLQASLLQGITNTTELPENNDRVFVLEDFSNLNDIVGSVQRSISSRLEGSLSFGGKHFVPRRKSSFINI